MTPGSQATATPRMPRNLALDKFLVDHHNHDDLA